QHGGEGWGGPLGPERSDGCAGARCDARVGRVSGPSVRRWLRAGDPGPGRGSFRLPELIGVRRSSTGCRARDPGSGANHVCVSAAGGARGLMSYGVNVVDNFLRAASFVDRILKGPKTA